MNPDQKMQGERNKRERKTGIREKERQEQEKETRKKFSTHFNRKSSAESEHDSLRGTSIPKTSKISGFFSKNGQIFFQKWEDFSKNLRNFAKNGKIFCKNLRNFMNELML